MSCNEMKNKCSKNGYSLAMAYVPWQEWKNVMCAQEGMKQGTIFSDLVMPFYGSNYRKWG